MAELAEELQAIHDFPDLLPFLKERMGWPIDDDILEDDDALEDLTFEFTPSELGIDPDKVPNIREIRQLRSFTSEQPFGVFLISFDDKELRTTAMRRILRSLVKKRRAESSAAMQQRWDVNDLIFVSNFGESGQRKLSFAHFHDDETTGQLPTLRVIGWDEDDTATRMRIQAHELTQKLRYPDDPSDLAAWRRQWNGAFTREAGETIRTTKQLVTELAKLATDTRRAIEDVLAMESANGVLHGIMNAFKENIFPDLKPEAFADMYAQTVAYGLLQARIARVSGALVLDDAANLMPATNPFLKELFETFLSVGDAKTDLDFDEIGLSEVRDLLSNTDMEQVLADFGNSNQGQDPKIFLYENFLKEYDKDRKDKHGVFYTPKEVVGFIVRSVHETLQQDFGLADGLADTTTWAAFAASHDDVKIPEGWDNEPFVQILDPATGTGTFLLETVDVIHGHLMAKWQGEGKSEAECQKLWQAYVPEHLLPRLHGFELMMAPYAMAHMLLAIKLADTGYQHGEGGPRAQIYLTNSLSEPFDAASQFDFIGDALAVEGKGANHVKMDVPITVIIGNPPYSGHSMNNGLEEIRSAVKDYTSEFPDLQKPGQGKWLQDDYVKFLRWSELLLSRRDAAILCFITNHSYLDNPTFKGMRKSLSETYSRLSLLDLHGNAKKKEKTPNGQPDQNVFEIQQGVSIILGSFGANKPTKEVFAGDLWGEAGVKLSALSSGSSKDHTPIRLDVKAPLFLFKYRDTKVEDEYQSFPSIVDVMGRNGDPAPGIVTTHDSFAISWTKEEACEKVEILLSTENEAEARGDFRLCTQDQWNYEAAKKHLAEHDYTTDLVEVEYRPFDRRHTIYNKHVAVHRRERVMRHMLQSAGVGLVTVRQMSAAGQGWFHVFVSNKIIESCSISNRTKEINYLFPLNLLPDGELLNEATPNLSSGFLRQISDQTQMAFQPLIEREAEQQQLNVAPKQPKQTDLSELVFHERGDMANTFGCRDVFDYIYAVLHSPTYRTRYADFLKSDFPRIPLPAGAEVFSALVPLGRELVALHLLDKTHPKLAKPSIRFVGQGDNRLAQKGDIKLDNGKMMINAAQWFEDVPEASVEFAIGGYQPLKKWLHDRAEKGGQNPSPGRVLSEDDVLHYRRMVVALTETQRVMNEIDAAIDAHGGWPGAFKSE